MPKTNQETRTVDESAEQVARDKAVADELAREIEAATKQSDEALRQLAEQAALDAQDPITYRYNNNASDGERLIGVPLSDLRQSVWDELPKWSKQAVTKSHLYTKVEAK